MHTSEKRPALLGVSQVSPLPPIVFRAPNQAESDSSFSHYIDREFQPFSAVLQDRASLQPKNMTESRIQQSTEQQEVSQQPKRAQLPEDRTGTSEQHNQLLEQSPEHTTPANGIQPNDEEQQQQYPWWVLNDDDEDGFYSIGGILFLFGFLCPFLWWIGACYPRHPNERAGKMAERWQQLNLAMSLGFSVVLIIALVVLAVMYSQGT